MPPTRVDQISSIGIDDQGSLWVKPSTSVFPYIYREAMEVKWDSEQLYLFSPKPREWSHLEWFQQIKAAAREQGVELITGPTTQWSNIDSPLRRAIESQR